MGVRLTPVPPGLAADLAAPIDYQHPSHAKINGMEWLGTAASAVGSWLAEEWLALGAAIMAFITLRLRIVDRRNEQPRHKLTAHVGKSATQSGNEPQQDYQFVLVRFQCIGKPVSIESFTFRYANARNKAPSLRTTNPPKGPVDLLVASGVAERMPTLPIESIRLEDGADRKWAFSLDQNPDLGPNLPDKKVVVVAKLSHGEEIISPPFSY